MMKRYFILLMALSALLMVGCAGQQKQNLDQLSRQTKAAQASYATATPATGFKLLSVNASGVTKNLDIDALKTYFGNNIALNLNAAETNLLWDTGVNYDTHIRASNTVASTATGTGNINLDGLLYQDYNYSNGASAATYTPVFTAPPVAGQVRGVIATFGGGAGVCTMTWTNITRWIGTTGAAATTANKRSTYAFFVYNSEVVGKIVQEAY